MDRLGIRVKVDAHGDPDGDEAQYPQHFLLFGVGPDVDQLRLAFLFARTLGSRRCRAHEIGRAHV